MKKFYALSLLALVGGMAMAENILPNGDGYYRIRNAATGRYVYLKDGKGSIDYENRTPDLTGIGLNSYNANKADDASTIFYIQQVGDVSDNKYDITCQGVTLSTVLGKYTRLAKSANGGYYAYANYSNGAAVVSWFLKDGTNRTASYEGQMSYTTSQAADNARVWELVPLTFSDASDPKKPASAPGLQPTIKGKGQGGYWGSYNFTNNIWLPEGIVVYYVALVKGNIVMKPFGSQYVPANMPFVACMPNATAALNPYQLVSPMVRDLPQNPADNYLRGTKFASSRVNAEGKVVNDYTAFNPAFQRVLGFNNGQIGFVADPTRTGDVETIDVKGGTTRAMADEEEVVIAPNSSYFSYIEPDKEEPTVSAEGKLEDAEGNEVKIEDLVDDEVIEDVTEAIQAVAKDETPADVAMEVVDAEGNEDTEVITATDDEPTVEVVSEPVVYEVANVDESEITGDDEESHIVGIETVEADEAAAEVYTVFGTKANAAAKGILIVNGQKVCK